ncbi:hypothetical protein ACO2Q3_16385 [Caulobacter sp. KR2-114]|uniref:hypothetical protein n=1 Tax=Caulobacter sp. KR2-114 TaxID=3400912 RepID=UPI003BFDF5AB
MSLDAHRLRQALLLATGDQPDIEALDDLSRGLGVVEEGLAYVLLRRSGFAGCPQVSAAIAEAAARAPAPNRTARPADGTDSRRREQAQEALRGALRAIIEGAAAQGEPAAQAADAWRAVAEWGPGGGFDAHLRIRRP